MKNNAGSGLIGQISGDNFYLVSALAVFLIKLRLV